jgi:hypothetical protein
MISPQRHPNAIRLVHRTIRSEIIFPQSLKNEATENNLN